MTYTEQLADFVKAWEGLKLSPSHDPLNPSIVDVGYGHVIQHDEWVRPITTDEANELLHWDLNIVADGVNNLLTRPVPFQCQFDALCSFAYNVGLDIDDDYDPEGLGDSTLLKHVNAGDYGAAAAQFTLWCHAGGVVVQGLLKRRLAEQAMWVNGDYSGRP